jgi:heptosyltransferase-1
MFTNGSPGSILAVRLSAMGDIIHTIPAVAWLKQTYPRAAVSWLVESKWADLLEHNPYVDEVISLNRQSWGSAFACCRELRARRFDLAVDFQGLLKSAIPAALTRAARVVGFAAPRERLAKFLYHRRAAVSEGHVVERYLRLAEAAGARPGVIECPMPAGRPEGELPARDFVLASPLAGWEAKQWPLEHYGTLGALLQQKLGLALVLNGAPSAASTLTAVPHTSAHLSSLAGLIDATRRATAVIGLDSGPLHLAAALLKPGVAIFGPTDPARNGPYGTSFVVLRSPRAVTTYKRARCVDASMRDVSPQQVLTALREQLRA